MGLSCGKRRPELETEPDCAVIEITLRCNFKCLHCGSSAGPVRSEELSLKEFRAAAEDLKRIGFRRVSLIGGEPFIRPDWREIAAIFSDAGLAITYVTNGSLFSTRPELIEEVISTRPQVIGFSIDGGTAETHDKIRGFSGAFERVWQSIDLFRSKGIETTAITAVNKLNVGELALIRDRLLGRKVAWQIQICSHNGNRFGKEMFVSREEYTEVARFIHETVSSVPAEELAIGGADDIGYYSSRYTSCNVNGTAWSGCKAGVTNLGIQSNGDVKGCLSLPDSFVEGNLRRKSLYEIWFDRDSFNYTRNFKPELLQGFCAKCPHGSRCKGGCIDIANSISGHPFENGYCLYKQEHRPLD